MVGGSKTVYFLARQFIGRDYHVTILNRDPARAKELAEQTRATVVLGDGADPNRLEEAGARRADALLALTSHDQDNLVSCQIAQRMFGVPRVMALVNDPENEPIFERLGVTVAFSATRVIASLIEQQTNFDDITRLMPIAKGRVNVTDVHLDEHSPAIGKSLMEVELTENSIIACIVRGDEVIVPRGATRLEVHDHLILISQPEHEQQDLETLCGPLE
jgi:trk system potassium uptake protein TrkA